MDLPYSRFLAAHKVQGTGDWVSGTSGQGSNPSQPETLRHPSLRVPGRVIGGTLVLTDVVPRVRRSYVSCRPKV